MSTLRQDMKRFKIVNRCHDAIVRQGAHARVIIKMPGTPNKCVTRRMAAGGPRGTIITHTVSGKKAIVMFKAVDLLTSMEVIRRG